MITIATIVEGHGEVKAVPVLLRRLGGLMGVAVDAPRPFRTGRQLVVKPGELERAVELVAGRSGPDGRILILLDADTECPRDLAREFLKRARATRKDRIISVVLAKMEYEAWFLAAVSSVAGRRGLKSDIPPPRDPEAIRDAKGWLSSRMKEGRAYSPSTDQPALTAVFDMEAAREKARSFDKLYREVESLLLTE